MKRIIIVFILFMFLFIPARFIKAEDSTYQIMRLADGSTMSFLTSTDDQINFEKKIGEYEYRITLNNHIALNIDFSSRRVAFIKFYEGVTHYYIYGGVYNDYDSNDLTCTPYIIKVEKNLTFYDSYFDEREELSGSSHFVRMVEYGVGTFCFTEFVSGKYSAGTYTGLFQLRTFDGNLNEIKTIDCGSEYATVSIAYDCLDVLSGGNHYYFDINFNRLDEYKTNEEIDSYILIYEDCMVNSKQYKKGSVISEPGIYVLNDGIHKEKTITLNATVDLIGEKTGEYFNDYVEYKISGGNVYLNDKYSYLNGCVSKPGVYKIKIKGINGYEKDHEFMINATLLTEIDDGGVLNIGESIDFTGVGKLNGVDVKNGFKLTECGSYVFDLYAGEKLVKEVRFTVPQVTKTTNNSNIVYIVFVAILAVTTLVLLVIYVIVRRKNRRHKK